MTKTFKNLDEFYAIMFNPTQQAIMYVTEKILDELSLNIGKLGIGDDSRNLVYNSTGEFNQSFIDDLATRVGEYIIGNVRFDPSNMTLDEENFVHGSFISGDARQGLAEIIFEGKSGGLFGQGFWTQSRDAWTPTMNRLDKSFNKWMIEGFRLAGFSIKKAELE